MKPWLRYLLVIGGAVVFWVGVLATLTAATSHPLFCAACHEIRPEVDAWRRSPHAEVSCYSCHAMPGAEGFGRAKIALADWFYKHLSGLYEEPVNKLGRVARTMKSGVCLRCHPLNRKVTPAKGVRIDHEVHRKKGMTCTLCHNRVSHPSLKGRVDYLKMPGCFRCHSLAKGAKATGKCSACHTSTFDLKPKDHRPKTWRRKNHGASARRDRKRCVMCHLPKFCDDCHQLAMPHPPDWGRGRNVHARVGARTPAKCVNCHTEADFCNTCHHEGYDPKKGPWVRQHFGIVKAKGVYNCIQCHTLLFCSTCHVRGLSQPGQPPR